MKSLNKMKEFKRFQGSTFDEFSRRRLIEDRDTILELTGEIQELQNEINCRSDSRDFQDAESIRSGLSHFPSQPVFFPPFRDSDEMLRRSMGMPSRSDRPPDIWDTHVFSGNVFVNPTASSSAPFSQRFNPWIWTYITACNEWKPNTSFGSEMPVRTVSQIHSTQVREDF